MATGPTGRGNAGIALVTATMALRRPSGEYAGSASRFVAYAVDLVVSTILLVVTVASFVAFVDIVTGAEIKLEVATEVGATATAIWLYLYFFASWATAGKTPGMALFGVRVVRRDGRALGVGRAAVRTLAFPLSFLAFGLGLVGIVIGREHRALHDVIAGTTVVYDWEMRPPAQ